jgi:glycosyltransferase involved in cell wall biosynthesis
VSSVCFLAWRDLAHPAAGGSEVLVDRLAAGLAARGHQVALVAASPVRQRAYPVTGVGGRFTVYLRAPLEVLRRHRRVDVVIDVENGIPFFAPLWRRGPTVCLVHHVHDRQWRQHFPAPVAAVGRLLELRVMPRLYRRCLFLAVSTSTAAALAVIGVDPSAVRTMTQGIEPRPGAVARVPAGEPVFVVLGRLVPHKGVDRVLFAWAEVHRVTGGRLVIVGDGPDMRRMRGLARHVPGVELVGRVSDDEKWALLEDAWFLVHGAHHEGWGIAVMEAASLGRPTLAFDVPGVRDSVVDGVTGVLVEDEPDLVDAWIALVADPQRCADLGHAALARAATHGWDAAVDALEGVLAEALG